MTTITNNRNLTELAIAQWLMDNRAHEREEIKALVWDTLARCRSREAIANEIGFGWRNPSAWEIFYNWVFSELNYRYDQDTKTFIFMESE
jgi:hypothetical protein